VLYDLASQKRTGHATGPQHNNKTYSLHKLILKIMQHSTSWKQQCDTATALQVIVVAAHASDAKVRNSWGSSSRTLT